MSDNFIIEQKLKHYTKYLWKTNFYNLSFEKIVVDSANFKTKIGNSNALFFISKKIDIPNTAKIKMSSVDNFLVFSKTEFEELQLAEYECFSDYLKVKTESYGENFIPFILKFIKITPFN